ncbi:hypothetical protein M8C21_019000 [Ambrosia artemisiifolia]|uniref:CCT domain-containing protein n=1 Tax=Ambrosia artemisiifolia TaxID=4212 RepID=A0AAD5GK87_AMBAR|nr:hypothetical protein M8C21_019000 [Ambrosia artemisiifolia]
MLHDVVHPPNQPPMEQVSSPLSAQILEFCESDLFQETIQNSDVASASNCYEEQSSYVNGISFPPDMTKYTTPTTTTTTTATTTDGGNDNYTPLFEEKNIENDISAPQEYTNIHEYPFSNQDQFDLSLLQNQLQFAMDGPIMPYPHPNDQATDVLSMMGVCESECMSMPPSKCMRLNNNNNPSSPNHCFLDHPYFPSRNSNSMLPIESCGIFNGSLSFANEIQAHELDFLGDNGGFFFPDPLPRPYNSNELQALSNESQHLVNNGNGSCNHPLAPPEITSLESESFRVANKLTSEERKEKIHRYMKKRNERNFSKKIKYACRKTLADSRPRVRGRFAKNDEFGEHHRNSCNTHEEDTDEDVKSMHVRTKGQQL